MFIINGNIMITILTSSIIIIITSITTIIKMTIIFLDQRPESHRPEASVDRQTSEESDHDADDDDYDHDDNDHDHEHNDDQLDA